MRRPRRRASLPALLGLILGAALLLSSPSPALAQDGATDEAVERTRVGSLAFTLPEGWRVETLPEQELAGQPAKAVRLVGLDERLRVLILVAEPFGYDLSWDPHDLMAPAIVEALAQEGAVTSRIKLEKTSCEFAHGHEPGRMGYSEIVVDDTERFVTAVGCGIPEPSRWALVLLVVDAAYQRPVALQATVEQSVELFESMGFE